jgi:2-oxo-3-hexenedioate decarboxylase
MWAHIWSTTVIEGKGETILPLDRFVQPRIEPEVVFKLRDRPPLNALPSEMLRSVEWMSAGFEIVQCHFADWKFTVADATADFGLHGALVVGRPMFIDEHNRDVVAAALSAFELTLRCDGTYVDRGVGSNVLGGPLHALAHLTGVLVDQPRYAPLSDGDIVTTGTITKAWPVAPGERWTSDYGSLGLEGLTTSLS